MPEGRPKGPKSRRSKKIKRKIYALMLRHHLKVKTKRYKPFKLDLTPKEK